MSLWPFLSRGHQCCPTRGHRVYPISKACYRSDRNGNCELGLKHPFSESTDVNCNTSAIQLNICE